jgi:PTS system fructose-specific IIA component
VTIEATEISNVLNEQLIDLAMEANTKHEVLIKMIDLLYLNHRLIDKKDFLNDVLNREQQGMTGIGHGIAIPHGKSNAVRRTALAIARTNRPIAWTSLDGQPVNVIILFAVRAADAGTLHLKLLQGVATLLADDRVLDRFQKIRHKREIIALFTQT